MVYIRRLIWDTWNIAHIARHEVRPEEVEEVCHGPAVARQTYAGRTLIIGPTRAQRMLAVVLDPEAENEWYPVTARPASRQERRLYREEQGGTST
jgi:uncharacterized protein